MKVFQDLLLTPGDAAQKATVEEEDHSFASLASNIRVYTIDESNKMLMEEGEIGDLFYIILDGTCQVLKSHPIVIESIIEEESVYDRVPLYFRAFMENYDQIFWAGMDIKKEEFDSMLGIVHETKDDDSSREII